MSEVGRWLALVFGGFGVPVLIYIWRRLGQVQFDPSDWRRNFRESTLPGLLFIGDDNRASPNRAGVMECSFSVKIFNGKRVNTTLHRIAGVFHLPSGRMHSAEIYDPEAGNTLKSLHLPAKQPVAKELWIQIYVSAVGREVMDNLASAERVVFDARYPSGWPYRTGGSLHKGA